MAATRSRDEIVFVEALRSMPALVLARSEDRQDDAKILIAGIMESGKEQKLCPGETNRQAFHAAYWWFREAITALAADRGQPLEEVVKTFSAAAADFVARDG